MQWTERGLTTCKSKLRMCVYRYCIAVIQDLCMCTPLQQTNNGLWSSSAPRKGDLAVTVSRKNTKLQTEKKIQITSIKNCSPRILKESELGKLITSKHIHWYKGLGITRGPTIWYSYDTWVTMQYYHNIVICWVLQYHVLQFFLTFSTANHFPKVFSKGVPIPFYYFRYQFRYLNLGSSQYQVPIWYQPKQNKTKSFKTRGIIVIYQNKDLNRTV